MRVGPTRCIPHLLSALRLAQSPHQPCSHPMPLPPLVRTSRFGLHPTPAQVHPNGSVFWSKQVSIKLACPLQLDELPFDTQRCTYLMGLYQDTEDQVALRWRTGRDALTQWHSTCVAEFIAISLEQDSPVISYESNYTYARAHVTFVRREWPLLLSYFVPVVLICFVSMLGFWIDPDAAAARVSLAVIGLLIVLQNYLSLTDTLPAGQPTTWLQKFQLTSFLFILLTFMEQVAVSFGRQALKWYETQQHRVAATSTWLQALNQSSSSLEKLFKEWDEAGDGDGMVSKAEFRHGVMKLRVGARQEDINKLFDRLDRDRSGAITRDELLDFIRQLAEEERNPARETKPRCRESQILSTVSNSLHRRSMMFRNRGQGNHMKKAPAGCASGENDGRCMDEMSYRPEKDAPGKILSKRHCGSSDRVVRLPGHGRGTSTAAAAPPPASPPASPPWAVSEKRLPLRAARTSSDVTRKFQRQAAEDLDKGPVWRFKFFVLFPLVVNLRHLDHISRPVFPVLYSIVIAAFLSGANFSSQGHMDSPCV